MTTPIEEKRIWDEKARGNVKYEVWNEHDEVRWDEDADRCVEIIMDKLDHKGVLLEIGCGIGRLTYRIATRYPVDVVGIDVSEEMIDRAPWFIRVRYIVNDGRSIPLEIPDGSIDGAYSMITFQHIEEDVFQGYLREVSRVLQTGGKFVFQYVRGDGKGPLSYCYEDYDVVRWCEEVGLCIENVQCGLIYDEWTWVTVVKE